MAGLTWSGHDSAGGARAKGRDQGSVPGARAAERIRQQVPVYGEVDLGKISPGEMHQAQEEQTEKQAASRGDASARAAATPEATLQTRGNDAWDIAGAAAASSRFESDAHGGEVARNSSAGSPAAALRARMPQPGWDLVLCSFSFAEKGVAGGTDAARLGHLNEVGVWSAARF